MKVNQLIALSTLSTLCIAASAAVSADPVTFEASAPASSRSASLMQVTRIAFPQPTQGPFDEVQALMNTMDQLPAMIFPSPAGPSSKITGGAHRASMGYAVNGARPETFSSVFALETPETARTTREAAATAELAARPAATGVSYVRSASLDLPTLTPGKPVTFTRAATDSTPALQVSNVSSLQADPYSLERLYNQHRLFSDNPAVPFAQYDQSDLNVNDQSADAFQNNAFVPDRPFPYNQPQYGDSADYTTDLEVAGGLAVLGVVLAHSGHHHPIPEASSVIGLSMLCAGGSLALLRARRRTTA